MRSLLIRKIRSAHFHMKATTGFGHLPNAIGIGGTKCGTTSLFWYMRQHPDVSASRLKELHYFDDQFDKPIAWYRANFSSVGRSALRFECTPGYLHHPLAPQRAASVVPHAKLIVLLRNPVDRAYSHYNQAVRQGLEALSFEEALEREEARLAQLDPNAPVPPKHWAWSLKRRGFYAEALKRWLKHYDRQRFLILRSEDLFADPQRAMDEVFCFLGLAARAVPDLRPQNDSEYPAMSPGTRSRLEALYEGPNRTLKRLVGICW